MRITLVFVFAGLLALPLGAWLRNRMRSLWKNRPLSSVEEAVRRCAE